MQVDLVDHLASMGGYFDEAVISQISVKEVADEIQQLRNRVKELEADIESETKWASSYAARYYAAISLVDGAKICVELFRFNDETEYQKKWRAQWLADAQRELNRME